MLAQNMQRLICLAACCALFAGCRAVGPNYRGTSAPALEPNFVNEPASSADTSATDNAPISAASWEHFRDHRLDSLVQSALRDSPTLQELAWRINESRALLSIVSGQRDPFADAFATYERRKRSSNSQPFVAQNGDGFNFFSVGVDSRWELDLFGRIQRETEAAKADYQATIEDRNDLQRVLIADVIRAYIDVRLYQELLSQNQTNVSIQREALDKVQTRIQAGKVGRLDLVQLESRVGLTESDSPFYAEQLRLSFHRLALLVGQTPNSELEALIGVGSQLPILNIATGVPMDLLRNRPDIRRAEREVAAACARIGVAESELYPKLALAGTVSLDSRKVSSLLNSDSVLFGFGPSFSWNILSLGRIERGIEIQKAQLQQAIQRYRQAVLVAVSEVEDGLASQQKNVTRLKILHKTVFDSGEAVHLASQQYEADRVTLERVVSNQRRLLRSSIELTQTRAELARASVGLIQAVGGQQLEQVINDCSSVSQF